jgi:O-antigen ligase
MSAAASIAPARPLRASPARTMMVAGIFLGAHALLAVLVRVAPVFSTLHAVVTLIAATLIAATRPRRQLAYALAYIAASEVLWRMARGVPVHEFAKYATAAVIAISLLRFPPRQNRGLAIGYFLLLVPSAYLTFAALDVDGSRQQISFNLSGPLSLALCVLFFSQLKITMEDARRLLFVGIGPIFSIATFSIFSTISRQNLEFKNGSNSAVSGGFGPNQVSAVLGLGLLLLLLLIFQRRTTWRARLPLIVLAAIFAIQATLTFSRGGIGIAAGAAFVALFYLIRDRRSRIALFVVATVLGGLGYYVIYPKLQEFTKGKLTERYTNTNSSNRITFARYDLEIYRDHPMFGVGPGMATELRDELGTRGIAHTEFTRMLAEHGTLGALAFVLLIVLTLRTLRRTVGLIPKAFVAALLAWAALFLAIDAMRLVAPSVVVGLACTFAYSSKWWTART